VSGKARLLFLVTEDWYFCSHRLAIAMAARDAGYEVAVATRFSNHRQQVEEAGLRTFFIPFFRGGWNPVRELPTLRAIMRAYRAFRPHIVHHVAIKPVLYGSLAARCARVPAVVNALAGLGYVFTSRDAKARLLRPFVKLAYRGVLNYPGGRLILQNQDDLSLFVAQGIIHASQTVLIRGSGVQLGNYPVTPEPPGTPLVVLPARMLRDKGVEEFVEAARIVQGRGVPARFALVGSPDPENPASIPQSRLEEWAQRGIVEYWGWRDDIAQILASASIVCLPSYREGLPKALVEAAACARPIVTCDVPGCREVVLHGDNGLLVPPRDSDALADALIALLRDAPLRQRMGRRGRARAEAEFAMESVVSATLQLYCALLAK
jgi:glycosyltransferase involved in cell wall biosynthesis